MITDIERGATAARAEAARARQQEHYRSTLDESRIATMVDEVLEFLPFGTRVNHQDGQQDGLPQTAVMGTRASESAGLKLAFSVMPHPTRHRLDFQGWEYEEGSEAGSMTWRMSADSRKPGHVSETLFRALNNTLNLSPEQNAALKTMLLPTRPQKTR
jgi:hypothetical protein